MSRDHLLNEAEVSRNKLLDGVHPAPRPALANNGRGQSVIQASMRRQAFRLLQLVSACFSCRHRERGFASVVSVIALSVVDGDGWDVVSCVDHGS